MKKTYKYLVYILVSLSIISCRDESLNPIPTSKLLNGVTFEAVSKSSAYLDAANTNVDKLVFDTKSNMPDNIAKIEVMAEYLPAGGTAIKNKLLSTISTVSTNYTTNTIPYSQFLTALGITASTLQPGDVIRAKFVATTTDGRTFSEDNTVGTLPSSGSSAFTRAINITIACTFNPAQFGGTWVIKQDGWQDYAVGDVISVKPGPAANQLTIGVFATKTNHQDIILTVTDTNTGVVKVDKQAYGSYTGDPAIWSAEGTGSISGCAGTIDLTLTHSSPDYGTYTGNKLQLIRK